MTYILDIPATPRFHIYLTLLMGFVFWMPIIAFAWFMAYYCFFFDEMKHECLNYEEYLDDCIDMFHAETDEDVAKVYKTAEDLKEYYRKTRKPLPQELKNYTDSTSGPSGDFNQGRPMDEWDSPDLVFIQNVLEWIRNDWEYTAEVELEDEFDFQVEDLEQHYVFFESHREEFRGPHLNRFETSSHSYVSNTGAASRASSQLVTSLDKTIPMDIRLFFSSTPVDDFRFTYWNKRFQKEDQLSEIVATKIQKNP